MKRSKTKKYILIVAGILVVVLVYVFILVLSPGVDFFRYFSYNPVYETDDISDYGIVEGNYDNDSPQAFVCSFFPEKIEEFFSDVSYHYKAKKLDTYAYEMYLEFVIEDTGKYNSFLMDIIGDKVCEPFYFNTEFQACYISNYLTLTSGIPHPISNAKVGMILFSNEEQRIIFVALGVYDGGGTNVEELNFFFNKFDIDPIEFDERSTPGIIGP